jgi:hypothetical protein
MPDIDGTPCRWRSRPQHQLRTHAVRQSLVGRVRTMWRAGGSSPGAFAVLKLTNLVGQPAPQVDVLHAEIR